MVQSPPPVQVTPLAQSELAEQLTVHDEPAGQSTEHGPAPQANAHAEPLPHVPPAALHALQSVVGEVHAPATHRSGAVHSALVVHPASPPESRCGRASGPSPASCPASSVTAWSFAAV